ncbi:hypothetical protein ASPZODRAFT_17956 [Penicilliopsis zonata CBS 506.65]|uniref:Uncharacterized protein n=1 Tax=Penicilliopsis zonata CBS 506.65 TaxID=1073090 RepID=A0A1L9SD38_9EURO|nr:hypothetical protein ASPZODRAFT_17956 [Penicilliopsis zonata CBS 506.65]OJJ45042.1 hypothetical protein ASPZODRAFT_17956 [Penicilliopsis zonata CBS 506.65]
METVSANSHKRQYGATIIISGGTHVILLREENWRESLNIHSLPQQLFLKGSGSIHKQYTALRSIHCHVQYPTLFQENAETFEFDEGTLEEASRLLQSSSEWRRYLELLRRDVQIDSITEANTTLWPGSFTISRRLQEQVMTVDGIPGMARLSSQAPTSKKRGRNSSNVKSSLVEKIRKLPDAEDEAVPNAALIILNRIEFAPKFARGGYKAFTDGVLRSESNFVHLELKKRVRSGKTAKIEMQEACEVAGWLKQGSSNLPAFNNQ